MRCRHLLCACRLSHFNSFTVAAAHTHAHVPSPRNCTAPAHSLLLRVTQIRHARQQSYGEEYMYMCGGVFAAPLSLNTCKCYFTPEVIRGDMEASHSRQLNPAHVQHFCFNTSLCPPFPPFSLFHTTFFPFPFAWYACSNPTLPQ